MLSKFFELISLFLLILVTGTFWGTWFTLTRSIENFEASEFIHIGKTIIANVAVPMRILMPCSILFTLLSVLFYPQKTSAGFYFLLAASAFIILTLLITLLIEVPIDNKIKEWTPEKIPSNWLKMRKRWRFYHAMRTLTSLLCIACFLIAVLI
jgi:uncharacterized membrane protein